MNGIELLGIFLGLFGFALFVAFFYGDYTRSLENGKTRTYAMTRVAVMVLMFFIVAGLVAYTTIGRKFIVWFFWSNPILPLSGSSEFRSLGLYPAGLDDWPTIAQIADWLFLPIVCLFAIMCGWIALDSRSKRSKA